MTPQERQARLLALQETFERTILQLRGKPGEAVPFEFTYTGTDPIQCYTLGCGCTSAEYEERDGQVVIYGTIDVDSLEHIRKYYVKESNQTTWVKNASITVFFEDGEDFFTLEGKERVLNPDKVTVGLSVNISVDLT